MLTNFSRLLFFSGVFNIVLAAPLIVPGLVESYFLFLWEVNQWLGLGGVEPLVPAEGVNALLVNTAGIDLVLIGSIVIYAGFAPAKRLFIPFINAIGRSAFAALVIYYWLVHDLAGIVVLVGGIDLMISAGFVYFLIKCKNTR